MTMSPVKILILGLLALAALVALTVLFYLVFFNQAAAPPVDEGAPIFTQAAETLMFQLTQVAADATGTAEALPPTRTPTVTVIVPTETPRPTNTPLVIATNTPIFTPTALPTSIAGTSTPGTGGVAPPPPGTPGTPGAYCNAAKFIEDVTIPDNTRLNPGTGFIKTWRLENYGSCTWTTNYSLVFVDGDQMSAPDEIPLPQEVEPGDTIDLSVSMIAPINPGTYESYWKLADASGVLFGTGSFAEKSIWVIIDVKEVSSGLAFDFTSSACAAKWESGAGTLPCPGKDGDKNGFVIPLSNPQLENRNEDEPGLLTHPEMKDNGFISGRYPPFTVKSGDVFIADIGCAADSDDCRVTFRLDYRNESGAVKNLGEWNETSDGYLTSLNIDLSDLAGKTIEFILSVSANGSSSDDNAVWFVPQIDRD